MLQIKDEIPVRNFPEKPKLNRKVRLAVDPKTIAQPPKTEASKEPDGAQPTVETDLPALTPVAPPPRRTPYLWRKRSPGNNVDRQGLRWTQD